MQLGVDSRSVYEEDFERPFLEMSAEFYRVRLRTSVLVWNKNRYLLIFVLLFTNRAKVKSFWRRTARASTSRKSNSASTKRRSAPRTILTRARRSASFAWVQRRSTTTLHHVIGVIYFVFCRQVLEDELISAHMKTVVEVCLDSCKQV